MDILHTRGNKPALEGHDPLGEWTGFMNTRKFQRRDSLTEKLLSSQPNQAEHACGVDSLIRGLVDLLPKRDAVWPLRERAKWLRLAAGIFDLGYKASDGEQREISISVVKQDTD